MCREIIQRSEEHTSELQSQSNLVCRLLLEKKKIEPILGPLHVSPIAATGASYWRVALAEGSALLVATAHSAPRRTLEVLAALPPSYDAPTTCRRRRMGADRVARASPYSHDAHMAWAVALRDVAGV